MARGGEALNGFVDSGCTIRGELEFAESFRLDGRVEGQVRSAAELVVGERGVVDGEIDVARCLVGGEVHGVIRASERVVLHGTAKVWADIHTPALVMEDGAVLEGRVVMGGGGAKTTPKAPTAEVETGDSAPGSAS
jgi:cytoskeletal protein CcmA (bactofilin family)